MAAAKKIPKKKVTKKKAAKKTGATPKYPRHAISKVLRIPEAIFAQNAGQPCTDRESAPFVGVAYNGPYQVELSSAIKYGLISRPEPGHVAATELASKIIRPQDPQDRIDGLREATLMAPDISAVYQHYRGENLPDTQFFNNALTDKFKIPADKVVEFTDIFIDTLKTAELLEEHNGKQRVLDVSQELAPEGTSDNAIRKMGKAAKIDSNDSCFVIMPFADPIGSYYKSIYETAIQTAGMKAIRADNDIFATGKVIDQIWKGINDSKVLVAELTNKNPNVYYELGLAHALQKPVVLVSSNEDDVPFDLQHIRVIYYDVNDPFWGDKLIKKVAENILSAINNPEEAIFMSAPV